MFSKRKCAYRTCISNWSSDGYSSDPIGSSPAVQVRVRILPDSDAKDYRRWEVMLTNARPFDAAVELLIPFAIDLAPQDWERRDAAWVLRVTVPANDRHVKGFREGLQGDESRRGGGGGTGGKGGT